MQDSSTLAAVRVRFFASARAAAGVGESTIDLPAGSTIGDLLAVVLASAGATASGTVGAGNRTQLERVLARCSFLVNTVATTDRGTVLGDGDLVDVMPPFAGG